MRGGIAVWRRGKSGHGIDEAVDYAFNGACDGISNSHQPISLPSPEDLAAGHSHAVDYADETVKRHTVTADGIKQSDLNRDKLKLWVQGKDPETGELRGRSNEHESSHLMYDSTINGPKSLSLAGLIKPEIREAYEALQDRVRDRLINLIFENLNSRRGAGGQTLMGLAQVEIVELHHEQSRSLDPHHHRHLWVNARVLGTDGKWSGLDSSVLYKLQTLLNSEGELAMRTDPEWIAALAASGYTLNSEGEISQLAHLVRPLSQRSNQIEANRQRLEQDWRADNPGHEPGPVLRRQWDRLAWSLDRPNKPSTVDADLWLETIRSELTSIDRSLFDDRQPVFPNFVDIASLDRTFLAEVATVIADDRSQVHSGRFSEWDARAAAVMAVSKSKVVAERTHLEELITDITDRILSDFAVTLDDNHLDLKHIKRYRSTATQLLRDRVSAGWAELAKPGKTVVTPSEFIPVAKTSFGLDHRQAEAVIAITSTAGLVTVEGAAGAGKTTMLKVAEDIMHRSGGQMLVLAPTQHAAHVAATELKSPTDSIHSLLHDYGFRWERTASGREQWVRLRPGDIDPGIDTHPPSVYQGPVKHQLHSHTRIVVDEAGMVDLNAARALQQIAQEYKCGVALVGDPFQLQPVGHAGAMEFAMRFSDHHVEMTEVHRFKLETGEEDTAYADLTIRMRKAANIEEATRVAQELADRNQLQLVGDTNDVIDYMVQRWQDATEEGRSIAISVSTNEEAQAINNRIQQQRLTQGAINPKRSCAGQQGQLLYEGDVIQTRRNNRELNVSNRDVWVITSIDNDTVTLVSQSGKSRTNVPAEYLEQWGHLAYASTIHGVQGSTTDYAVVGPGTGSAGIYVGLTRGRYRNEILTHAKNTEVAVEALAQAIIHRGVELTDEQSQLRIQDEIQRAAKRIIQPSPVISSRVSSMIDLNPDF